MRIRPPVRGNLTSSFHWLEAAVLWERRLPAVSRMLIRGQRKRLRHPGHPQEPSPLDWALIHGLPHPSGLPCPPDLACGCFLLKSPLPFPLYHPWWNTVVVQPLSHVLLFVTPWTAARQASLSFTVSRKLLKLMAIESMVPSNHLILCCPLLHLPSTFPSIWVFSNDSSSHQVVKMFRALASSSVFPRKIQGWFPLGLTILISLQSNTLKSLFQHHSSKVSILQHSAFFLV